MKQKSKLTLIIIIIVVFVVTSFSTILLNRISRISFETHLDLADSMASQYAAFFQTQENTCISNLSMLAKIIAGYEQYPNDHRRLFVENIQYTLMLKDKTILELYVVFKPNVLDGRDSEFFGRLRGVAASGQYALLYSAETSGLKISTVPDDEIIAVMEHINGLERMNVRVGNHFIAEYGGFNRIVTRFMVPIINSDNQVTGAVGAIIDISPIQSALTQIVRENESISSMALYSADGFIIGHVWQDRVGKMIRDVEIGYGPQIDKVVNAVRMGEDLYLSEYSPALRTNIEMTLKSFEIGDSGYTWTVMIGIMEDYIFKETIDMTRFTVMLAVLFILLTATIIFVVVPGFFKENGQAA
jgi:methyl-accepting chemotaxis protein